MERHYEGSHTLFLESRAQSMSLQICISLFALELTDLVAWRHLNLSLHFA